MQVGIKVFQGEREMAADNQMLGQQEPQHLAAIRSSLIGIIGRFLS